MHSIKHTVAAVVAASALSLVAAACSDVEPPANEIGQGGNTKDKGPAPKGPVKTNPNRLDFGDGEAKVPARPKAPKDNNSSRLNFGDDGRN